MFNFRRSDDSNLRLRLEAQETAHAALAREFAAYRAEMTEALLLVTRVAVPAWLRDAIDRAKASGWLVTVIANGIEFHRPDEPEHSYKVPLPLPDNEAEQKRRRDDLLLRVFAFEQRAA